MLDHLAQSFEPGRTYLEAQVNEILLRFHSDYAALRRYLVDDQFLSREDNLYWFRRHCPRMTRGHTVLQAPVPELEPFVLARTAHYDTDYPSTTRPRARLRHRALGLFLPELDAEAAATVARIVAGTTAFDFTLARVATFPNGIIHLVPELDDSFRELTRRLGLRVPAVPAVRRAVRRASAPDPGRLIDAVTEESTRELLGDLVPARCRAGRLDLAWYAPRDCRVLRSWALAGERR